jgi:hypothetical protein
MTPLEEKKDQIIDLMSYDDVNRKFFIKLLDECIKMAVDESRIIRDCDTCKHIELSFRDKPCNVCNLGNYSKWEEKT